MTFKNLRLDYSSRPANSFNVEALIQKLINMASHTPANNIGLALSGGGYRASVFHLGTLKKLHELKILDKVDVISTISGGSITGAAWLLYKGPYEKFHQEMVNKFNNKNVIRRIIFSFTFLFAIIVFGGLIAFSVWLTTTSYAKWAFPVFALFLLLFLFFQFKIFPVSRVIERAYNEFFYQHQTFSSLKTRPILAIGSSNLHTGRPFTFSQEKMSDSSYSNWIIEKEEKDANGNKVVTSKRINIEFLPADFPIARAVAASSCVPFAFTPILIDAAYYKNREHAKLVAPVLVDGGVYDNQGIQKITQHKSRYECKTIITSDAGGQFLGIKKYRNVMALLMRTVDLFIYRIKAGQMVQNIYNNTEDIGRPIAYFSLGWNLTACIPGFVDAMIDKQVLKSVLDHHDLDPQWIENPATYRNQIIEKLKANTRFDSIMARNVTEPTLSWAKKTGTSLKSLSMDRIIALITHAENLTELQVKLYCPALVNQPAVIA